MMLLVSAGSLISAYLGLELLALSSYALVALNRDSAVSAEAAIKYFVLGALASGLLLYGMSMIYGATGTLDLARISASIGQVEHPGWLAFGLIFLIAGIAFKLGAAPFHMWLPDVYQGAPTAITVFIGSAPKLAAFGLAYRLLEGGLGGLSEHWTLMLAILSVFSLAIGNLFAIAQTNLKRMLAYSTISHVGFLLLGFVGASPAGFSAAMFYAISYSLTAAVAFGMIAPARARGFRVRGNRRFQGPQPAQPLVRRDHGHRHVLAGRRAAAVRLLRQAAGAQGRHRRRLPLARHRRDRVRDHRHLLLPARGQGHVLRRRSRYLGTAAADRRAVALGHLLERAWP